MQGNKHYCRYTHLPSYNHFTYHGEPKMTKKTTRARADLNSFISLLGVLAILAALSGVAVHHDAISRAENGQPLATFAGH